MRTIKRPIVVSERARKLHRRALVLDLHTDSLIASKLLHYDLARRHTAPAGQRPWRLHADIPRLREGGVDAVFLGIVTHPFPRGAYKRALKTIAYARSVLERNPDDLAFATTAEEIESARREGKIAVLLGVEGMHMLDGCPQHVADLYSLGVRYITMAHFSTNRCAVSSADFTKKTACLTPEGIEALDLMDELGMMVDVTHTHTDIIQEVCARSKRPVIVSHSACAALRPTYRNLQDPDIRSIAATGGVIGLIYSTYWLSKEDRDPPLSVIVDHADHIRDLVGVDHLALGSDWDGMIKTPDGMRDASDMPALTQLFLDRGYDEDEVEKILGLNFMRVFRQFG